ncbi:MAG: hypothetical protein KTR35_04700 [Gammaproteobacteria bacterium]|nr:hypothetical protein [Gammaproteobacteria bacterium]
MIGIAYPYGYGGQTYLQEEAAKVRAEQTAAEQDTPEVNQTAPASNYPAPYHYSSFRGTSISTVSDNHTDSGASSTDAPPVAHPGSAFPLFAGGYGSQYRPEPEPVLDPVNSEADQRKLAERYAPILVLPKGSNDNLPASANDFIENSRLREDVSWWTDNQHGNNTNDDTSDDFTGADFADAPDNYFLDLDNDQRYELGRGQDDPAPLYYDLDLESDSPTLTYFVFYAYNDGPTVQNHEGDWERITLELDPETFEPTTARLSAHGHRTDVPVEDIADPLTGRPVIYVAAGSHAAFPEAGVYDTEVEVFKDHTVQNPDNVPFRRLDDAVIYTNWGGLQDVTAQSWYPSEGNKGVRWGEIGELDATSGPYGPSSEKGAVDNPVWGVDEDGFFGRLADTSFVQRVVTGGGDAVEDVHDTGGALYDPVRNELQENYSPLAPLIDWLKPKES